MTCLTSISPVDQRASKTHVSLATLTRELPATPQLDWEGQFALLKSLPPGAQAPAFGALAASCAPMAFFDHGDFVWVRDKDLMFATLSAHSTDDSSRFVLRYEMHRTSFLGRVPTIGNQPPLNFANIAVRPNFGTVEDGERMRKAHSATVRNSDPSLILDAREHPLRAKIAFGLMETLSTAGFMTEPSWRSQYRAFADHRGIDVKSERWMYDYGDRKPRPQVDLPHVTAMPVPYLAFDVHDVDAACSSVFVTDEQRSLWPIAVLDGFLEEFGTGLVFRAPTEGILLSHRKLRERGTFELIFQGSEGRFVIELPGHAVPSLRDGARVVMGSEVAVLSPRLRPAYWENRTPRERLDSAECHFGDDLPLLLSLWLKNQAVLFEGKPGLAYFPSTLLATAAAFSKPEELVWRMEEVGVTPSCFDTESAFFRYPALPFIDRQHMLATLPSEVQVDFRPYDPAFAVHLRAPEPTLVAINEIETGEMICA